MKFLLEIGSFARSTWCSRVGVSGGKLGRFVGFSKQKRDECGGNHVGGLWV